MTRASLCFAAGEKLPLGRDVADLSPGVVPTGPGLATESPEAPAVEPQLHRGNGAGHSKLYRVNAEHQTEKNGEKGHYHSIF